MGASMWHALVGSWTQAAGTGPGTVTLPNGAILIQIVCHAQPAGTLTIFGGSTMALPPNDVWRIQFMHALVVAKSGANQIVFGANTTSYFVEYITVP